MASLEAQALNYFNFIKESLAETLWPKRCAICDVPGASLCTECERKLPYIDQNYACPICGAAHGKLACTECNKLSLELRGLGKFPLDGCRSVCIAEPSALKLIRIYKDSGEQNLAKPLGKLLAQTIPWTWRSAQLVPIPAREDSLKKRGFDHIDRLSHEVARQSQLHRVQLLEDTGKQDQRELNAKERLKNMQGAFKLKGSLTSSTKEGELNEYGEFDKNRPPNIPSNIILLDDVMTTGATLYTAAAFLREAGAKRIYALTFARV